MTLTPPLVKVALGKGSWGEGMLRPPFAFAVALALTFSSLAWGTAADVPACTQDAEGRVDYAACAQAAPIGSPARALALINLGSLAVLEGDFETAVRYYDEAQAENPGMELLSDASFHAFRAAAFDHVGRTELAMEEATAALDVLKGADRGPMPSATDAQSRAALNFILPILNKGEQRSAFVEAAELFLALPPESWADHANRAGLLEQLDRLAEAVAAADQSLMLAPDQPFVLNNACYIRVRAGLAADGLPLCERAARALPNAAPVHHSHASALAALGRCAEAEAAIARARRLAPANATYAAGVACRQD